MNRYTQGYNTCQKECLDILDKEIENINETIITAKAQDDQERVNWGLAVNKILERVKSNIDSLLPKK